MEKKIRIDIRTDKNCYIIGEKIKVIIDILNLGTSTLKLNFNSMQQYDFIVLKDHKEVWRWSTNKMFAMVLNSINIESHGKKELTEILDPQLSPGEYELIGIINSKPPYKASCLFKVK